MRQGALTVVLRVRNGKKEALSDVLTEAGSEKGDRLGFDRVRSLHFGRMVLLPPPPTVEGSSGWLLAVETNFDGQLEAHVAELVREVGERLGDVLLHCEDAPAAGDAAAMTKYLLANVATTQTFYNAHQGQTRAQIENDRAVRAAVEDAADALRREDPACAERSPAKLRAEIRRRVAEAHPELRLDPDLPEGPSVVDAVIDACRVLPSLLFTLFGIVPIAVTLRRKEEADAAEVLKSEIGFDDPEKDAHLDKLLSMEDWLPQNPLTHLAIIKPGLLRMFAVRTVLASVDWLGRYIYRHGRLGELANIHFARWVILPDRRVLFFSNYDGSWENYLGDFIDKASKGLTAVWSNTVGYPPTRFLCWGGAKDEERFKAWARAGQVPTQLWYSAYPDRTVTNVLDDAKLRRSVASDRDADLPTLLETL